MNDGKVIKQSTKENSSMNQNLEDINKKGKKRTNDAFESPKSTSQ